MDWGFVDAKALMGPPRAICALDAALVLLTSIRHSKPLQLQKVAGSQSFLLGARPTLDLTFTPQSLTKGRTRLRVDQRDRASCARKR